MKQFLDILSYPTSTIGRVWFCLLVLFITSSLRGQVYGAMDVWPDNTSIEINGSRQFGAYAPITPNTVEWLVNEVVGGDSVLGTISSSGLYKAPSIAPANNTLTIKARSAAFPGTSAQTTIKVTRKYPWLWGVNPSSAQVGTFVLTLNGSNFAPDSEVLLQGQPVPTTYHSPTRLTAIVSTSGPGVLPISVRQPSPGLVIGNSVNLTVQAATVTVAVSPTSTAVGLGTARQFYASVSGTSNLGVTWSVNGIA